MLPTSQSAALAGIWIDTGEASLMGTSSETLSIPSMSAYTIRRLL
jgi:hypothetical protein